MTAQAIAIAKRELEALRAAESPAAEGVAEFVLGMALEGDAAHPHLRRAIELLERSSRKLELAHALVQHGAALRRANRRKAAAEPLKRGMDLAERCGARPLVERAREELAAMGSRPRTVVLSGVDALTASELRVARMAADGMSNPEIAQALFVTRRTVETHLTSIYRKLEIGSRGELPGALSG